MKHPKQLKPVIRRLKRLFKLSRKRLQLNHVRLTWLVIICLIGLAGVYKQHKLEAYQYRIETNKSLYDAHIRLQELFQQVDGKDTKLKEKARIEAELKAKIRKLEKDLQAKKEQQSLIAKIVSPKVYAAEIVNGCGDNQYASFIYMKESGCNLNSTNSQGCYGIGQDCNGIVRSKCGADYACQNAYFTSYVTARYGGWQGAYNFWLANHWY